MRSTEKAIPILLIFLFGIAGVEASLALPKLLGEEPATHTEFTTRFYVVNESEILFGKPAFYRTIIENQEGTTVDYELKVLLAGKTISDQEIRLNSSDSLNQTVSFIPNHTGDYQKLEFLLYKNNEPYRTRVFQVAWTTDNSLAPDLTATPLPPQNTYAETTIAQEPGGEEFTENYSTQQVGDITVYKFNTGEKLELKISNGIIGDEDAVYTTTGQGNKIIFLGETYEKVVLGVVNTGAANYLNPVIMDAVDIVLKANDTLKLKNGYAITLNYVNNQSSKFTVSKNNIILREIINSENSPMEYWQDIDDNKKQKMIRIMPKKIYDGEIVFDLIQYGGNKVVLVGDKYGEFQVTNITEDSITMKNIQPIKIDAGQEISLINGKIKIKV